MFPDGCARLISEGFRVDFPFKHNYNFPTWRRPILLPTTKSLTHHTSTRRRIRDRLATIATLLGMTSAQVDACHVLEMGCGAGGNLIPMAFDLPESSFVGIDLAGSAIAQGRELIAALGLKNISLQQLDVMAFPSELGQFDYIVVHGYSAARSGRN